MGHRSRDGAPWGGPGAESGAPGSPGDPFAAPPLAAGPQGYAAGPGYGGHPYAPGPYTPDSYAPDPYGHGPAGDAADPSAAGPAVDSAEPGGPGDAPYGHYGRVEDPGAFAPPDGAAGYGNGGAQAGPAPGGYGYGPFPAPGHQGPAAAEPTAAQGPFADPGPGAAPGYDGYGGPEPGGAAPYGAVYQEYGPSGGYEAYGPLSDARCLPGGIPPGSDGAFAAEATSPGGFGPPPAEPIGYGDYGRAEEFGGAVPAGPAPEPGLPDYGTGEAAAEAEPGSFGAPARFGEPSPRAAEPERERWAQWSYASFDRGDGAGGWQVKETRGDPDPAELAALGERTVTAFDSHDPLPEYPTRADVAAQPRRLAYGPLPIRGRTVGAYLHAVQAGSDATGRPGNVFTHGFIDRGPRAAGPAWRPIELWRSFDWLVPYGAEEVLAARLPEIDEPRPSGLVGRALVLDFLFAPGAWRIGLLSLLVDAVAARMRGGAPIVIAAASPDEAAQWIAAVSMLMSPATARTLSWSLYERADRLRSLWERGTHIVCVPLQDAERVPAGCVLVRADETPQLGQRAQAPHRTARGDAVEAGGWSELAQEVLLDREAAAAGLERVDEISARAGDAVPGPEWPLALLVLQDGERPEDTLAVARRLVLRSAPAEPIEDEELRELSERAVTSGFGEGPAAAWQAFEALASDPEEAQLLPLAREAYLAAALADESWLCAPDRPRAPGDGEPSPGAVRAFLAAIGPQDAQAPRLPPDHPEPAVRMLRIADLAVRSGALPHAELHEALVAGLARDAVPALATPGIAEAALDRAGELDPEVHARLVPEAVEAEREVLAAAPPGQALTPQAVDWIARHGRTPGFRRALAEPLAPRGVTERETIVHRLRAGERLAGLALAGAAVLAEHYGEWSAIPAAERIVSPTLLWRAEELTAFERHLPGVLPVEFFEPTIACAQEDEPVAELAAALAARPEGDPAGALAGVVLAAGTPTTMPAATARSIVAGLFQHYGTALRAIRFAPAVLDAALRAHLAEGHAQWREEELQALRAMRGPQAIAAAMPALVRRVAAPAGGMTAQDVCLVAVSTAERCPEPARLPQLCELASLTDPEDAGRRPVRLLDRLAAEALAVRPEVARGLEEALTSALGEGTARFVRSWTADVLRIPTSGPDGAPDPGEDDWLGMLRRDGKES
ncbi:MAG: hypothetical protein Q4E05_01580 [Pseudoclavibacter sp.]|nr:hypothetical protein [Pseudoclavibacter sp.]